MASINKPAIPCALNIYVTNDNTSKSIKSPLKPARFTSQRI